MTAADHPLVRAAAAADIEVFLQLALPPEWAGIGARILESGAEFSPTPCSWAPRWSPIPLTVRRGRNDLETAAKSVIYRVHDALHQLWGLPHPGSFSEDDRYYFKRVQMCGEVAVLTLTEFVYVSRLAEAYPELQALLHSRNALPLLRSVLRGADAHRIAARLDGLLHRGIRPAWVRNDPVATAFADDYIPMLEADRAQVDVNWNLMRDAQWTPHNAPRAAFGRNLDGLELTLWMIDDFNHHLCSQDEVDVALMHFNRQRRRALKLPEGWVS